MSETKIIATVKEYEKDKIYRLNRRLDGLYELLETMDNTKIAFKTPEKLQEDVKKDIVDCKSRIQKWWDIIGKKYNLPPEETFSVSFESVEITKS